jgi:two-component system cell cycle sensor histidine kinase/response regulator CckA
MRIKTKFIFTMLGMSILVAIMGVLAVNRQQATALAGAIKEAEDVARVMGLTLMSDTNKLSPSAQEAVLRLHQTEQRDVVLVDANQLILADAIPAEIGQNYTDDTEDEVGSTIKDRKVRTFIEVSKDYPSGIKQIAVPIESETGQVIGAVILEYTPIYDGLMQLTKTTIWQLILAGLGCFFFALLISFYMGRSLVQPLLQLTNVATGFASGRTNLPMPAPRKDEIGELAASFDLMVQKRQQAENDLCFLRDDLEVRVAVRTAELAQVNEDLQGENTKRKLAQESSQASEEKFLQLADNITDAFWITSPDLKKIYYISAAYQQIWGRSIEGLYADPHQWVNSILPVDRERVFSMFSALMGTELQVSVEYQIARPDGVIRWIHDRGFQVRDAAGNIVRLAGIASDITERKRIEETLRASEAQFRSFFEQAAVGVAQVSPDGRFQLANQRYADIVGRTREELQTCTFQEITHPDDLAKDVDSVRQLLAGEAQSYSRTKRYLRKNGDPVWVNLTVSLIAECAGQPRHFLAVAEDITERKQLETQLFQSQKLETVGKLAGGIAHEFNSIMTAIIGYSELMLGDLPSANPLYKNAKEIRHSAERAAALTRQLLAYGRKQCLQPEILDLNLVLASMEDTLRHLLGQGTNLLLVPAPALKTVKADVGQIQQVIMNLAMNAADAMPHGGKLTLETANVTLDQEYVRSIPDLKAGEYVMLAITDTGTGISEKVRTRLFEPFFTTKEVGSRVGLGLSTCYGIIKQSGGHISVYSELGRGTVFKIYLPQVEQLTKPPVPRSSSSDLPHGTETILMVEDDPDLREMAATLLKRLGYTVLVAANGIEALNIKQQCKVGYIDLLFTDVVMPHMGGKELSERILALSPHTRILFTSAYTANAVVHQGVLNNGVALLQKPFTPSALAHKLREVFDAIPQTAS